MKRASKLLLIVSLFGTGVAYLFSRVLPGLNTEVFAKSKLIEYLDHIQKVEVNKGAETSALHAPGTLALVRTGLIRFNNGWHVFNTTRVAPTEFIAIYASNSSVPISFGYSDKALVLYSQQDFYYLRSASDGEVSEVKALFQRLKSVEIGF